MQQKITTYQALETCAFALGRLRSDVEGHPLKSAFEFRMKLTEAVNSARLEDRSTDEFKVLGAISGLPIRRGRDYGGLSLALDIIQTLNVKASMEGHSSLQPAVDSLRRAYFYSHPPTLLQIADFIGDLSNDDAIGPAGRSLAGLILADSHLGGFYLSVSAGLTGAPGYRTVEDPKARTIHVLMRIARAAEAARQAFAAFKVEYADWQRLTSRVTKKGDDGFPVSGPSRRRNSRLPALVDLFMTINVLTASQAGNLLKMSSRGAVNLLRELSDLKLIVEVTHRSNWRVYVTREFARGNSDAITPQLRKRKRRAAPPSKLATPRCETSATQIGDPRNNDESVKNTPPETFDIDAILLEIDKALERTNNMLDEQKTYKKQ